MPKTLNLVGERYGRLAVVAPAEMIAGRKAYVCRCDCGAVKTVRSAYLVSGKVRSCGCLRAETAAHTAQSGAKTDARRRDPLYSRWNCMVQRCHNPRNPSFRNYGGRGIEVCPQWRDSFARFIADMGNPPTPEHTIDRIDNDDGYKPENCRWATPAQQLRNRRGNIQLTAHGRTMTAKDWAQATGIDYQRLTKTYRTEGQAAAEALVAQARF
jgi:hypothetical protein